MFWRRTQAKDEKDLVYVPSPSLSIEVKASGQAGFKVYGNRSYGQKSATDVPVKKEKSGFDLTVNFHNQALTLLRFGWIDADDWRPQAAATGQMAGLSQAIYDGKLIPIVGAYRRHAPLVVLAGAGPASMDDFAKLGLRTVGDLLEFSGELPAKLARVKMANRDFLAGCYDQL